MTTEEFVYVSKTMWQRYKVLSIYAAVVATAELILSVFH